MKNALRKGIVMATGLLALLSASAYGQTAFMRVNVPFDFHAGTSVLPAGEYRVNLDASAGRIEFRQMDGTAGIFVHARIESAAVREAGAAVFHQYGDTYVLRSVRGAGSAWAYEVGRTKLESELAKANSLPKIAELRAH